MPNRVQLLSSADLAPLVGRDDTMLRRYFASGLDGGLAMLGTRGQYFVHPNDVPEVVARFRARPDGRHLWRAQRRRSTDDNPLRPRVA